MVQIASSLVQSPRISANQLGEFVYASEKKQLDILRDQKFGNINAAPYYTAALRAVRRSFVNGHFLPLCCSAKLVFSTSRMRKHPKVR